MNLKIMPPNIQVECKKCEVPMVEVDPSLLGRIVELNRMGYQTFESCEGYHEDIQASEPRLDIDTEIECPGISIFNRSDDDETLYKTASALAELPKFKDIHINRDDEPVKALVFIDCYNEAFEDPDESISVWEFKVMKAEFSVFLTTLINELKAADQVQDGGEKE